MHVPRFVSKLRLLALQRSWGSNAAPLLIVGAPRTGSSFLTSALINGAGFSGSAEGHVTPLMVSIDRIIHGYYQHVRAIGMLDIPENTITKIPENELARKVVDVFNQYHRKIFHRGTRLLDKTVNVEAISALPFLLSIWPKAKIIYLTRDGVDNVVSAQKYFGVSLEEAARNWAACGRAWDRIAPSLPAASYITVSQNELTQKPLEVANRAADHLNLPSWRRTRFLRFVMRYTPEWRAARAQRPKLAELPWSTADQWTFVSICGQQMVAQGYADAEEIEQLLHRSRPKRVPLGAQQVHVLHIDDSDYFRPLDDGFLAVPGRSRACVLAFDQIETHGCNNLVATVSTLDPHSEGVRVEISVVDAADGALLGYLAQEIAKLSSESIALPLAKPADRIDIVIRLAIGKGAPSNDSAWVGFAGIALV